MNAYLYIAKLTDDYMGLQTPAEKLHQKWGKAVTERRGRPGFFPDTSREAPAVFKSGEYYYMITSGTSGWDPNPAKYYRSKDIMAEKWEAMGDPCEGRFQNNLLTLRAHMLCRLIRKMVSIFIWVTDGRMEI